MKVYILTEKQIAKLIKDKSFWTKGKTSELAIKWSDLKEILKAKINA